MTLDLSCRLVLASTIHFHHKSSTSPGQAVVASSSARRIRGRFTACPDSRASCSKIHAAASTSLAGDCPDVSQRPHQSALIVVCVSGGTIGRDAISSGLSNRNLRVGRYCREHGSRGSVL